MIFFRASDLLNFEPPNLEPPPKPPDVDFSPLRDAKLEEGILRLGQPEDEDEDEKFENDIILFTYSPI